ncbi:polysaccharide biosynthesis/export family protein [Sedimentisphaera salicampi]|uniref:polysaccharide biosynthesis/export family protein n=1 Tax=Sedimentisphaera salicampi TaxID=1941349 RepID=UPI000B9AA012|nr:polysaccharide biosynthesis/export family protein [Sedimentisphaera salicampi]OXU16047.1 polysaccharide export protein Wza [Sedimentisphaera salicampi]
MIRCTIYILLASLFLGCANRERFVPHIVDSPEMDKAAYTFVGARPRTEQQVVEQLRELQKVRMEPYTIGMSDVLDVQVYNESELSSKNLTVRTDGCISLPLVGDIEVMELSVAQATGKIEKAYEKYLVEPRVTLNPVEMKSGSFTILGKVTDSGTFPISSQMNLLDAIATAGGFQTGMFRGNTVEMADLENSYIVRDGKTLPVDFVKLIREQDMLHNIPLLPGDYIYVPSTRNQEIYVFGAVPSPAAYAYRDNMTVSHAITYSGGFKIGARRKDLRVVRGGLSNPVVFTVNYPEILDGQMLDFKLKPGDIVYVPQTPIANWNDLISQIMPTFETLDYAGVTNNEDNGR